MITLFKALLGAFKGAVKGVISQSVKKFKSFRPKNIISRLKPKNIIGRAKRELRIITNPKEYFKRAMPWRRRKPKLSYPEDPLARMGITEGTKQRELYDKAVVIADKNDIVDEMLRNTNTSAEYNALVDDIIQNPETLLNKSADELDLIEEMLNKELDFKFEGTPEEIQMDIYDKALKEAYDAYLDTWKQKFFESAGVMEDGNWREYTEEEKEDVWAGIAEERSFEWFMANKL